MRAMILAAGHGKRMGSLTKYTPKPLLKINGYYLIEYSLRLIAQTPIKEVIINICYHRPLIQQIVGDGRRYGLKIYYSEEKIALETGGGIYQALPLLGDEPFLVMSADIITDFPLQNLPKQPNQLAHIVLVDNPAYHLSGDFALQKDLVTLSGESSLLTFSNIGIYRPEFFSDCQAGYFRLGDQLKKMIANKQVTGEYYQGKWFNIGTVSELERVKQEKIGYFNNQ